MNLNYFETLLKTLQDKPVSFTATSNTWSLGDSNLLNF